MTAYLPRLLAFFITAAFFWPSAVLGQDVRVRALFNLEAPSGSPFPSDRFTVPDAEQLTGRRVNLPKPNCAERPSDCGDVDTINTLDGFNLQPRLSIPFTGAIDPATANSSTVFLVSLGDCVRRGRDEEEEEEDDDGEDSDDGGSDDDEQARSGTRIGINQVVWDPASHTLHAEADEFLDQHTRYALIVTRGVQDPAGNSVEASEAFRRFRHNLNFGRTKDRELKAYRKSLLRALRAAEAAGVRRRDVIVASVFTTQSITAILEKIRDQIKAATPAPADFMPDPSGARAVFAVSSLADITFLRQLRTDPTHPNFISPNVITRQSRQLRSLLDNAEFPGAVGQIAFGKYESPDYLTPCPPTPPCDPYIPPGGTRSGNPQVQGMSERYFNLFLPSGPTPPGGWPVVILGMGSGDNKELGPYLTAPALAAQRIALIAINGVGQGFGPLSTLTVRADRDGDGVIESVATFSAGARSFDQNGDGVIGTGVIPAFEGLENLPQGSFISRRDVLRQTVVDLLQLTRIIEVGVDVNADGVADLNPSRIYYSGFSHGAIHGTIFVAIEPLVRAAMLIAGGGGTIESFRLAPPGNRSFVGRYLDRRVPSLINAPDIGIANLAGVTVAGAPRFNENLPLRNGLPVTVALADGTSQIIQSPLSNAVPGAMEIQQVIEHTEWVVQSNDPSAYVAHLRKSPLAGVTAKPVILQFAKGDQTVPNPSTTALLRAGDLTDSATFFRNDLAFAANPTTLTKNPHEFATRLNVPQNVAQLAVQSAIVLAVQRQMAEFFASDGSVVIDPNGLCAACFFESPIALPLPEDLGFIP